VLNGILNFLLNEKSEQARVLLRRFVFKIISILNPDGVYRGYYRLDTKC
jgi:murein tripeptide amidase MpaA